MHTSLLFPAKEYEIPQTDKQKEKIQGIDNNVQIYNNSCPENRE